MSDDLAGYPQPLPSAKVAAPADDDAREASSRPGRAGEDSEKDEPTPDIRDLQRLFLGPIDIRSVALTGLFLFASILMLRFARELFLPIVLAVLFKFLLNPVIRVMARARIPAPLASLLVVLGTVAALGFVAWQTYEPAQAWLVRLPQALLQAEDKLQQLREPAKAVTEVARQVDELAGADPAQDSVEVRPATVSENLIGGIRRFAGTAAVTITLLVFLLGSGDLFLRKLVRVLPSLSDKKRAVEIAREIDADVSTYLATITLINIGLGAAVALVMAALDMPSPLFWGAMATCLNFVPYLGLAIGTATLALAAFLQFDPLPQMLLPPLAYVALSLLEANLVTPLILGRRLELNPVAVFLGIIFWGWLWGIPGALLAVPLLVAIKVFCDRVPPFATLGEFLGR